MEKLMSNFTQRVLLLSVVLAMCVSALAQSGTSRVTGTIQDRSGAVVSGAKITLTNEATNVSYTTTSTNTGAYTFEGIQSGTYSVTAEMAGFKKSVSNGNVVTVGKPLTVNSVMDVGGAGEVVEVTGSGDLVQTSDSGNFGNLVDQATIQSLPIVGARGRNPLEFVNYQPGVVVGSNTGGGVHVHGARDRAWNFTLDGVDINETSAGGSNFSPLRTNPDSVAEFRVITGNPSAEYGRNSGGQVTMVTKSGTNKFHGNLFWFYQTPALTANEHGNKINTPPLPRPQFVQNIYGGSIGGPIIKDKTFFFTNIQLLHTSRTRRVSTPVYTAQARTGIFRYVTNACSFSPCRNQPAGVANASVDATGNPIAGIPIGTYNVGTSDPAARGLDASIQTLLNLTPLPNDFTSGGDGLNIARFTWLAGEEERQVDEVVKIDHVFNSNHSIFGRWASGHQNTIGDFVNGGWAPFPGAPNVVDTLRKPRNLAVNYRWNLSPRMTNELILGMNRFIFDFANPDAAASTNPPFSFNNGIASPLQNYVGNARALTTFQLADNFSLVRNAHSFKWGANLRYGRHIDQRGSIGGLNAALAVDFSTGVNTVGSAFNTPTNINTSFDLPTLRGAINNLLGRVGNVSQGFVAANTGDAYAPAGTLLRVDFRMPEYDFYFQDNWRVRPNLVLDLGLRWEVRLSPRDTADQILRPDQPFGIGAAPSSSLKWAKGKLYQDDWNNFGPSIGIAWDPFGDGKQSVRANYRIAFDRMNTFSLSSGVFQGLPGKTAQITNQSFGQAGGRVGDGLPAVAPSAPPSAFTQPPASGASFSGGTGITVVDPSWETPKTHMWGLSLQREVLKSTVLEVSYVGRLGVDLYGAYNANQVDIFSNGFIDAFNTVKGGGDSALMNQIFSADSRRNTGETGSQMVRRLFASTLNLNSVASLAAAASTRVQGGTSLLVLSGLPQTFFMRYPQFGGGLNVLDSGDRSTYHALEVQLARRYTDGMSYQVSYTWAKSLDTRSFDPAFSRVSGGALQSASSTPFDINNRDLNYARSDFDRRHVLQGAFVYELPFGRSRRFVHDVNGGVDRIINGWQVSGVVNLSSGRPFTVYSGSNTYSNVVQTPANCADCSSGMGSIYFDTAANNPYLFTPEQRAKFSTPAAGQFSNVGRNAFDLPHFFNMDFAIGKKTTTVEGQNVEIRLEMVNAFNNVMYSLPNSSIYTSSFFARERGAGGNSARRMQLAMKYHF